MVACLPLAPVTTRADLEVSGSVRIQATTEFHAPLATHGTWIEVASHGRCWRPASVSVHWRPYCDGTWVWTDCGWYWHSDEPWAWAVYHYGYWAHDPGHGWVWIPGIEWAPAWVSWRVGGGYCGWAPLGPRGVVLGPTAFVFVETRRFHERIRPSRVVVNDSTVIGQTTVINGPVLARRNLGGKLDQSVFVNTGPDIAVVSKATGRKHSAASIGTVAGRSGPPREVVRQIQKESDLRKLDDPSRPTPDKGAAERKPELAPSPGKENAPRPQPPGLGRKHPAKTKPGKGPGREK